MGDSHHFTLFGTASWIATGAGARSTGGSSVLALSADADEAWTFGWWWANSKTCFPSVLAGCMEARLVALESELTEVRGEVLLLRSEVNRLRQRLVQEEGLRSSGDFGSASSVLDSPLRAPVTESGYSLVSEAELDTRGQGSVVGQSVSRVLSASAPISPAPAVLNWTQRELICRGIGTWIRDCLDRATSWCEWSGQDPFVQQVLACCQRLSRHRPRCPSAVSPIRFVPWIGEAWQ